MSDSIAPGQSSSGAPPLLADPQDPLPESNWKYRRWFVFLFGILAAIGVGAVLGTLSIAAVRGSMQAIEALYSLAWWLIILQALDRVLYLIAPSAEQATKMMATVHAWKNGVSTAITSRVATKGGTAEASALAGPAAAAESPASAPRPAAAPSAAPAAPATPAEPAAPAAAESEADIPDYARAS